MRSHQIDDQQFLIAGSFRFGLKQLVAYKVAPKTMNTNGKSIKHVVTLQFKEDASQEKVQDALSTFADLSKHIPQITKLEWGENDSTEGLSKDFQYTFTLTFNDEHGREIYLFHEAHTALVAKIGPLIADVLVMDYWTQK